MMEVTDVIVVDDVDTELGVMDKILAHQNGTLHRAFSIFIFNDLKEFLIHRRAEDKYHSGGLWTNACCSHPFPGEAIEQAATRRLKEEMGISCNLVKLFDFVYRAELENDMIEHEFDHVFIGWTNVEPVVNTAEVCDWKWISKEDLVRDVALNPDLYTAWFKIALPVLLEKSAEIKSIKI